MTNKQTAATLCALGGNAIFGFSFMFSRIALGVATPFVMLTYRFILAVLGLSIAAIWSVKRKNPPKESEDFMRFHLRGKNLLPLVGLGVVQPVAYFFCESYGIAMTNASFSGVIIALVPIVGLILGAVCLHEKATARQAIWSLVSIAGVIVMTLMQSAEGMVRPLGVLLLFGAVLSGVVFNIISRSIADRFSAFERTYVMMLVAAVTFTLLAVIENRADLHKLFAPLQSMPFMGSMGYLSLVSSIGAFMMLNFANNHLPVAKTTAFCNLTTVISVFAGVMFLGEPFSAAMLLAAAMIVAGVFMVQKG